MMRSIGVTNKAKKIIFCAVLKKPKIAVLFQYGNFDEWLMNEACHSNTFHIYNKKRNRGVKTKVKTPRLLAGFESALVTMLGEANGWKLIRTMSSEVWQ